MSSMCFEPVDEGNLLEAAEVHAASWQASHCRICSEDFVKQHTAQRQAAHFRSEMDLGKRVYLLRDHVPVGVVSVYEDVIENLYVHPVYWRRGYGSVLLEYAQAQCSGSPRLWVLSSNTAAKRLYEKHGYAETGNVKRLSKALDEIEMQKKSR